MKTRGLIIALSLWATLMTAQTSGLQFAVGGGGQLWQAEACNEASELSKGSFGLDASIGVRYAWYKTLGTSSQLGFMAGVGFGYGTNAIEGQTADAFVNTDYYGNDMQYTTQTRFKQTEQFWKTDIALLLAFRHQGFVAQAGPRFITPVGGTRSLSVSQSSIRAYYPAYGVEVEDALVTGRLDTPYSQSEKHPANWYSLAFALEVGWEWQLAGDNRLGVQACFDIGSTLAYKPQPYSPLVEVSQIDNTADPVPGVSVGWADPLVGKRLYIDFGLRLYYVLPLGTK